MSRYRSRASLSSPLVRHVQRHYQVSRLYRPVMPQMGGAPAAPQESSLAGAASAVPTAKPTGVVQAKLLPQPTNLPMGMVVGMGAPTTPVSQNLPVQAEFDTQATVETSAPQAAPTFWQRVQNLVRPQPQKPQAAAPSQRSLPIQAAPQPTMTPAPGPASSPAAAVQREALPAEPRPVIQPTQETPASAPTPPAPAVPLPQQRPVQAAKPTPQAQPPVQTPPKTAAPTPSSAIQTAAEPAESEESSGTDPKTWNRLQNIFQRHQEKQATQAGGDAPPVQTRREEEPSQPAAPRQTAQSVQRVEELFEETQVFQRPPGEMPAPAQPADTAPPRTSGAPQASQPVQKAAQPTSPSPASASTGPAEPPTSTTELDTPAPEAPLEMAWPVQRKNAPESAPAPTAAAPPPLPPLAKEEETGAGTLQNILSGVEAGRPTDSKIEVIPPRRARPTTVPVQRAADQASPEPTQQSPADVNPSAAIQREPVGAPETMVPTEVGSLPADLWQLIGETPPRQPARPTASSGQSPGPIQAAPQTAAQQAAPAPSLPVPTQVGSPSAAQPYQPAQSQPIQRSEFPAQNAAPERARSASLIQAPPQPKANIQREMLPPDAAKTSPEMPAAAVFAPASQPAPVQREETQAPVSSASSQAPAGTPTPAGSGAPVDTEELARKVYAELKRKLMVEWERNRFYANPRKR